MRHRNKLWLLVPSAGLVAWAALSFTPASAALASSRALHPHTASACSIVSNAELSTSLDLAAGCSQYFYIGANSGGAPLSGISWSPDLSVTALYSGNLSVSIGRSAKNDGSFASASGNVAIAGVGTEGYKVSNIYKTHTSEIGPGCSGCGLKNVAGPGLTLHFSSNGSGPVLILVGGEGTGNLVLTSSGWWPATLDNGTFSGGTVGVLASAGIFEAVLPAGSYSVKISSTTTLNNSGESLGAVAYELS